MCPLHFLQMRLCCYRNLRLHYPLYSQYPRTHHHSHHCLHLHPHPRCHLLQYPHLHSRSRRRPHRTVRLRSRLPHPAVLPALPGVLLPLLPQPVLSLLLQPRPDVLPLPLLQYAQPLISEALQSALQEGSHSL